MRKPGRTGLGGDPSQSWLKLGTNVGFGEWIIAAKK